MSGPRTRARAAIGTRERGGQAEDRTAMDDREGKRRNDWSVLGWTVLDWTGLD